MEKLKTSEIKDANISAKEINKFKHLQLEKSIKKYGQIKPIIVSEDNVIIDGHHVFRILKDLNFEEIWVFKVKEEVNKDQLYLELNMLDFELDGVKVFKMMKKSDINNNCIPFSKKDLEYFISLLDFDWNSFSEKKANGQQFLF